MFTAGTKKLRVNNVTTTKVVFKTKYKNDQL